MLDLPQLRLRPEPFAHAVHEKFLPEPLYRALASSFPACPPSGGPTGFSYFRGDARYDALMAQNEAWHSLNTALQSQSFIDYCIRQLGGACTARGCFIDLAAARYVDRYESRAEKARRHIEAGALQPEQLWVRCDILQGRIGYKREPHLDHRRRLLSMLIYFCDAAEIDMDGGALVLHGKTSAGALVDEHVIAPRHNLMVVFPCSADSFHSVSQIRSQRAPRDFVQITVSSSVDAWPSS